MMLLRSLLQDVKTCLTAEEDTLHNTGLNLIKISSDMLFVSKSVPFVTDGFRY